MTHNNKFTITDYITHTTYEPVLLPRFAKTVMLSHALQLIPILGPKVHQHKDTVTKCTEIRMAIMECALRAKERSIHSMLVQVKIGNDIIGEYRYNTEKVYELNDASATTCKNLLLDYTVFLYPELKDDLKQSGLYQS